MSEQQHLTRANEKLADDIAAIKVGTVLAVIGGGWLIWWLLGFYGWLS